MKNNSELKYFADWTKTQETKNKYTERAVLLISKAKSHFGLHEVDDARLVVAWLIGYKKKISKTTFRIYKAALLHYFSTHPNLPYAWIASLKLAREESYGANKKTNKTSAQKSKHVPQAKLDTLLNYLRSKEHKSDYLALANWIEVGILTGVRPCEWANARLGEYEGGLALFIQNAKTTNGRGNGKERVLILSNITENETILIQQHIADYAQLRSQKGSAEILVKHMSDILYRANLQLFGKEKKRITLYSARHQFSADAKNNRSKKEVAALMGHSNDATATEHYGKRQHGKRSGSVILAPEYLVDRVEETAKHFQRDRNQERTNQISKDFSAPEINFEN